MGDPQEFMKSCGMETTLVPGQLWILEERWRVHPGLCSLLLQCDKNIPSGGKETPCNARDPGSISGLERFPGEGNGNPLQYSCLENSMDRGAWQATVRGVTKSQTRLSDYHFHFQVWLRGSHSERLQETRGGGSCRLCLHCLIWVWVT